MRVLAIDAAGKSLSLAIAEEDKLVASATLNVGLTHSQRLLPMLAAMLEAAAMQVSDMDMVAVVNGPGSFTGLRIGIATAKGLAEATGKPMLGVSTLESEAYAARGMGAYICPVLDARRNEVYTALYDEAGVEIWPAMAIAPAELAARLNEFAAENAARFVFVGDAAALYIEQMKELVDTEVLICPPERRLFGACGCAFLALERSCQAGPPEQTQAFYLRLSEAERNRLAKLAAEGK